MMAESKWSDWCEYNFTDEGKGYKYRTKDRTMEMKSPDGKRASYTFGAEEEFDIVAGISYCEAVIEGDMDTFNDYHDMFTKGKKRTEAKK